MEDKNTDKNELDEKMHMKQILIAFPKSMMVTLVK